MRADRLVAVLLLLQRRGRVTAAEVAEELEVSERTARRDLEALGMAGLPVYSMRGRGGGWALSGGGRTDLSGLRAEEVRALFLLAGPSSSATPELRGALRKLVRALPESFRSSAEAAAGAVVVDPAGWDQTTRPRRDPAHLDALQQAVIESRQVVLGYVDRQGNETTRLVHPLGLAVKAHAWYLVAGTEAGRRTFRVDRVRSVVISDDAVARPDDFDLADTWLSITEELDERRNPVRVSALVVPELVQLVRWLFGTRMRIGPAGGDGRVQVELRGPNARGLAGEVAGFGAGVEVVDSDEVRRLLGEVGRELSVLYGGPDPVLTGPDRSL